MHLLQQTRPGAGESDEDQSGRTLYLQRVAYFRIALGELREGRAAGLDVWKQKGAAGYAIYHNSIYHTGHNEGQLTVEDINAAAKAAGATDKPQVDYSNILENTNTLAQTLELTGTHGLIVMPVKGATPENITVFPGLASAEQIQAAIKKPATDSQHCRR